MGESETTKKRERSEPFKDVDRHVSLIPSGSPEKMAKNAAAATGEKKGISKTKRD